MMADRDVAAVAQLGPHAQRAVGATGGRADVGRRKLLIGRLPGFLAAVGDPERRRKLLDARPLPSQLDYLTTEFRRITAGHEHGSFLPMDPEMPTPNFPRQTNDSTETGLITCPQDRSGSFRQQNPATNSVRGVL